MFLAPCSSGGCNAATANARHRPVSRSGSTQNLRGYHRWRGAHRDQRRAREGVPALSTTTGPSHALLGFAASAWTLTRLGLTPGCERRPQIGRGAPCAAAQRHTDTDRRAQPRTQSCERARPGMVVAPGAVRPPHALPLPSFNPIPRRGQLLCRMHQRRGIRRGPTDLAASDARLVSSRQRSRTDAVRSEDLRQRASADGASCGGGTSASPAAA